VARAGRADQADCDRGVAARAARTAAATSGPSPPADSDVATGTGADNADPGAGAFHAGRAAGGADASRGIAVGALRTPQSRHEPDGAPRAAARPPIVECPATTAGATACQRRATPGPDQCGPGATARPAGTARATTGRSGADAAATGATTRSTGATAAGSP